MTHKQEDELARLAENVRRAQIEVMEAARTVILHALSTPAGRSKEYVGGLRQRVVRVLGDPNHPDNEGWAAEERRLMAEQLARAAQADAIRQAVGDEFIEALSRVELNDPNHMDELLRKQGQWFSDVNLADEIEKGRKPS